jgi:hypothetical protein
MVTSASVIAAAFDADAPDAMLLKLAPSEIELLSVSANPAYFIT